MDDDRTDTRSPEEKRAAHTDSHPGLADRLGSMTLYCTQTAGTERAFTGSLLDEKRDGTYRCAACGEALFDSDDKYDSGSGWPSFTMPSGAAAVDVRTDSSLGMVRTETTCASCGAHLGHVFPDGPGAAGERYCINSACLVFDERPDD